MPEDTQGSPRSSMRIADYGAVATSAPINSDAARAVARGEVYKSAKKIAVPHWHAPPKQQPFTGPPEHDLRGRRSGSLTVVGYLGRQGRGPLWLVRCVCGSYEGRRTPSIKNEKTQDCCVHCQQLAYLKKSHRERHGKAPKLGGW